MYNLFSRFQFSIPVMCFGAVVVLAVVYIGLIAIVMGYATLTIEFSQSVRNDEAVVATLEEKYLSTIARITNTNFVEAGYTIPVVKIFVPAKSVTALR